MFDIVETMSPTLSPCGSERCDFPEKERWFGLEEPLSVYWMRLDGRGGRRRLQTQRSDWLLDVKWHLLLIRSQEQSKTSEGANQRPTVRAAPVGR